MEEMASGTSTFGQINPVCLRSFMHLKLFSRNSVWPFVARTHHISYKMSVYHSRAFASNAVNSAATLKFGSRPTMVSHAIETSKLMNILSKYAIKPSTIFMRRAFVASLLLSASVSHTNSIGNKLYR